jgi:multiple antibiotic resistance protein
MMQSVISFLAILNPFALALYLRGVMEDLAPRTFARVLLSACLISLGAFWLFSVWGELLLERLLGIRPAAMRIFGGVIFFVVGYNYVVKGFRTMEMLRGALEELPSAIALPFMIGAGTLTQSILIGKRHGALMSLAVLALGMTGTYTVVVAFNAMRHTMRGSREAVFDRYVNILVRANGLIIGAISAEMIVAGVHDLWFPAEEVLGP